MNEAEKKTTKNKKAINLSTKLMQKDEISSMKWM